MNDEQEKRYLYINGQAVPVSEQVYQEYRHFERKEEYFTYDLKTERFTCDQEAQRAIFTPSREDSYERLLAANSQFAQDILSLALTSLLAVLSCGILLPIRSLFSGENCSRSALAELHQDQKSRGIVLPPATPLRVDPSLISF